VVWQPAPLFFFGHNEIYDKTFSGYLFVLVMLEKDVALNSDIDATLSHLASLAGRIQRILYNETSNLSDVSGFLFVSKFCCEAEEVARQILNLVGLQLQFRLVPQAGICTLCIP
jgi:hypothetical protein